MPDVFPTMILVPAFRCPRAVDPAPGSAFPEIDPRISVVGLAAWTPEGGVIYREDVQALLAELASRSGSGAPHRWVLMPDADTLHALMIARFSVGVGFPLDACLLARLLLPSRHARNLPDALERLGLGGWRDTRSDGVGKVDQVESAKLRMAACANTKALVRLWERVAPVLAALPDEAPVIALQARIRLHRPLLIDADAVAQGLMALAGCDGSVDADRAQHLRRLLQGLQARSQSTGRLHTHFDYLRTAPGRFAAEGDLNLQTLPVPDRYPEGPLRVAAEALRQSLHCPAGQCLVAADASQIEPRITGAITGQLELHQWPAAGCDLYAMVAESLFGSRPDYADQAIRKACRALAKRAVLGLTYGMGSGRFVEGMRDDPISCAMVPAGGDGLRLADEIPDSFHRRFPLIRRAWHDMEVAGLNAMQGCAGSFGPVGFRREGHHLALVLPSGRSVRFADVRIGFDRSGTAELLSGKDRLFGAKLLQHVVTGIARDLLVHAMVQVELAGYPVIGHVHDSIICQVPIASADQCAEALPQAWRAMPIWALGLVLDAKVSMGRTLLFDGV